MHALAVMLLNTRPQEDEAVFSQDRSPRANRSFQYILPKAALKGFFLSHVILLFEAISYLPAFAISWGLQLPFGDAARTRRGPGRPDLAMNKTPGPICGHRTPPYLRIRQKVATARLSVGSGGWTAAREEKKKKKRRAKKNISKILQRPLCMLHRWTLERENYYITYDFKTSCKGVLSKELM